MRTMPQDDFDLFNISVAPVGTDGWSEVTLTSQRSGRTWTAVGPTERYAMAEAKDAAQRDGANVETAHGSGHAGLPGTPIRLTFDGDSWAAGDPT
jgi:hypothetical protein